MCLRVSLPSPFFGQDVGSFSRNVMTYLEYNFESKDQSLTLRKMTGVSRGNGM